MADAPKKKRKRIKSESDAAAPKKKRKRVKSESDAAAPKKKRKRVKSESDAAAPKKKRRPKSEGDVAAPKKKRRTKSEGAKIPQAKRGRGRAPRGDDDEDEERTSTGGLQPLHIGLSLGALALLLVGVGVALSGGKPPPPVASKSKVADKSAKTTSGTPVKVAGKTGSRTEGKGARRKGPPELPSDPQAALKTIQDYEASNPEDLGGLIELYDALLKTLDAKAGAGIERYVDKLRKRYAGEVGKKYEAYQARAKEKLDEEDFAAAVGIWKEAHAELRGEVRSAIGDEIRRVEAIQKGAEALVRGLDQLPSVGGGVADDALLDKLGLLLQKNSAAKGTKAFAKVVERAQTERVGYRGQRRERGEARVKAIREAIAAHERARVETWKARAKQAKDASLKKPIRVGKRKTQVMALGEGEFTLSTGGKMHFASQPKVTAQVLERACRPDEGSDLQELVVFSLKHRLFKTAERALKRLRRVDAALAEKLPDLEAMRRASRLFRGDPLRKQPPGHDGANYDFSKTGAEALLGDFEAIPAKTPLRVGGGLSSGDGSAMLKELAVRDHVTYDVLWPRGSNDGILEIRLDADGKKGARIGVYFANSGPRAAKLLLGSGVKRMESASEWLRVSGERLQVEVGGGRVRLSFGGAESVEVKVPTFSRALTLFGGIPAKGGGSIALRWPGFSVSAKLAPEWKRKSLLAYSATLYKALLDNPLELMVAGVGGPGEAPLELTSSDDPFALAGIGRDLRAAYRKAWEAQRAGKADPVEVEAAFTVVVQERGRLAGAYCGRALARRARQEWTGAEGDLDIAIDLDPLFYEALVARAELRLLFGDRKGAEADLRQALAQAPDLGGVHRGLGRIGLEAEDYEAARDAFGLALALNPKDSEARKYFLSVRHVAAGPPWETTFEHSSQHFVVRTNTSQDRAKQISALLELARGHYQKVVGTSEDAGSKRATCLVFDTGEGFNNYAALTSISGGLENVLGLYSPLYKQLLFFEDRNDTTGRALKKTLFHEGFHRYADEVIPGVPMWANEGLADLFGGELTFENGILEGRLANLEDALAKGRAPRVRDLVRMDRKRFYAEDSHINYAAAWSLCRYLLRGNAPANAKQAFNDFLARLRKRESPTKAFQKAFAAVDLGSLDRGWRKYVGSLRKQ